MNTLCNTSFSSLRKQCLISVAAVAVVTVFFGSVQPAAAMSFGHNTGGFHPVAASHPMGNFRAPGNFGSLNRSTGGLTHAPTAMRQSPSRLGTLRAPTATRASIHTEAARHVSTANRASETAKTAPKIEPKIEPKSAPVTTAKVDNAKIPPGHAGISVGDGNGGWKPYQPGPKDPPSVAQGKLDGGRDAGPGMKMRPGTERPDSWARVYNPDDGQTVTRTWKGDGTYIDTAYVSYGEIDGKIVRIDDLPRIAKKVQADCHLLAAKVAELAKQLAQQQAILSALEGGQNVTVSPTITGVSTSFASEDDQAAAVARMQARIATTAQLLAQYQGDLNRCLAGGN